MFMQEHGKKKESKIHVALQIIIITHFEATCCFEMRVL